MMSDADSSRVEALRQARQRRPWTDELLVKCASNPTAFKQRTSACSACPEPCEGDEVCATAVAKSEDLFESMGRDQAFHLLKNGMKRLWGQDEAELRTADREHPNTFLALVEDAEEPDRQHEAESGDERQTNLQKQ